MKLQVKTQQLTFSFEVLNFVFLALGLSVFLCGVWILFDKGNLLTAHPSDELRAVGAGLLMIGGVVVVVSVVGGVSAVKENKILLLTYEVFLIVLVLGQLFITLLLLLNRDKIKSDVDATLDLLIVHYRGGAESPDSLIDHIQHYEKCCGNMDSSDWLKNQHQNLTGLDLVPCSCLNTSRTWSGWCPEQPGVFKEGCTEKVGDWLQENIVTMTGMLLSLMFVQMVLFVLVASLYYAINRRAALTDTDHAPLDPPPEDDPTDGEHNYSYIDPDEGYIGPAHPAHLHDYPEPVEPAHLYTNTS